MNPVPELGDRRIYDDLKLWSVTTILSQGIPKPRLVAWNGRVCAERAVDDHGIIEAFLEKGERTFQVNK